MKIVLGSYTQQICTITPHLTQSLCNSLPLVFDFPRNPHLIRGHDLLIGLFFFMQRALRRFTTSTMTHKTFSREPMAKPIITLNGKIVIMLGMLVIILTGIRFAADIIVPLFWRSFWR
jgi:hypothetical protein